ncbi:polyphenol oxidase family protein [Bifidobacterium mongoliense]|uniref:polyphenol oxidase family protein n=1 Tax=Bifidobacterium mongoliense TaxID=518643 RepID=UPI002A753EDE|nr:polyphenol oxidase family protein [Bifidobacterium mongoliense]MDY3125602.1 polyphenol oxidase family protein [Bifidobacterium mongoliense]
MTGYDQNPEAGQQDREIIDSSAMSPVDRDGNPIPVTIPIEMAPGVKAIYTTRLGGVSEGGFADCNLGGKGGENPERTLRNRMALSRTVGGALSIVSQVHSAVVADMDEAYERNAPFGCDLSGSGDAPALEADSQIISRPGVALGVFAADCLPVLFADTCSGMIAAAHCGRKGLQRGVIEATVAAMVAKGASPVSIVATLGPCICGDCYEVGGAIADDFDAQFPGTYTLTRFSGPGVDIAAAALQCLGRAGIPRDNIIDSRRRVTAATQYLSEDEELVDLCRRDDEGAPQLAERLAVLRHPLCTFENPLWYSHRRAVQSNKAEEGRLLALVIRER